MANIIRPDLWRAACGRLHSLRRQDAAGAYGRLILAIFWTWYGNPIRPRAWWRKPEEVPRVKRWILRLERAGLIVRDDGGKAPDVPWLLLPDINDTRWVLAPNLVRELAREEHRIEVGEEAAMRVYGPAGSIEQAFGVEPYGHVS